MRLALFVECQLELLEKTLNGKFEILMNEKMNVVVDILENGGWCDNNKHTKIFAP